VAGSGRLATLGMSRNRLVCPSIVPISAKVVQELWRVRVVLDGDVVEADRFRRVHGSCSCRMSACWGVMNTPN